ncbi:uncharacterized protein LOC144753875 [Lissotriton helveticus]
MSPNKKFFEAWKSVFPILKVSVVTLILFVFEELMEVEFTCPAEQRWKRFYSLAFFCFPASFWFLLSLLLQQSYFTVCRCKGGCQCSLCCSVLGKAFLPSILWVIILLFDGRYLDCLAKSYKKSASNIVEGGQPPTQAYLLSQVIGMLLFLVVLLGILLVSYFPVWYCKCGEQVCKEGRSYDEIQYEQLMVEEAESQIIKKTQKKRSQAIKTLLEEEMQDSNSMEGNDVWDMSAISEQLKPLLQKVATWVKNKLSPPANNDSINMKNM